jgi:hypothetical protein
MTSLTSPVTVWFASKPKLKLVVELNWTTPKRAAVLDTENDRMRVVRNVVNWAGREVILLFVSPPYEASMTRPISTAS